MQRSDVSANYKTKFCKNYLEKGTCPYGNRCQFIHDEKPGILPPKSMPKLTTVQPNAPKGAKASTVSHIEAPQKKAF